MGKIENLEAMLQRGQDSALLRFSLGAEYLNASEPAKALEHLARAVAQQPDYSAAWKLYGKALVAVGQPEQAVEAFDSGIAAARDKGDIQAAKEMEVFRKRALKDLSGAG